MYFLNLGVTGLNATFSFHFLHLFSFFFLFVSDSSQKPDPKSRSASKPMQPEDYQRIEQDLHNQLAQARRQESHHKVLHLWHANFDSEHASRAPSGVDYDSVLRDDEDDHDDGEETFYSMCAAHDVLPPLEEPQLPVDMVTGSAALPSQGLCGLAAGGFLSTGSLASVGLGSALMPGKSREGSVNQSINRPTDRPTDRPIDQLTN